MKKFLIREVSIGAASIAAILMMDWHFVGVEVIEGEFVVFGKSLILPLVGVRNDFCSCFGRFQTITWYHLTVFDFGKYFYFFLVGVAWQNQWTTFRGVKIRYMGRRGNLTPVRFLPPLLHIQDRSLNIVARLIQCPQFLVKASLVI